MGIFSGNPSPEQYFRDHPVALIDDDVRHHQALNMSASEFKAARAEAMQRHRAEQAAEAAAEARLNLVGRLRALNVKAAQHRARADEFERDGKQAIARQIRDGELFNLELKIDRAVSQLEHMTTDKAELRRLRQAAGLR